MDKFLIKLNKLTENKYTYLRVNSVQTHVTDALCEITLLIPQHIYDFELTQEDKDEILDNAKKIIPHPFKIKINYKKSFPDTTFILKDILDYVNLNFPALNSVIKESSVDISLEGETIKIKFALEHSAHAYFKHSSAEEKIKRHLSHQYCNTIEFYFDIREDRIVEEDKVVDEFSISSYFVTVSDIRKLLGKEISARPKYIKDVTKEEARVAVSGKINSMYRRTKRDSDQVYYAFNLDDTTGIMKVLYFPKIWQTKNMDDKALKRARRTYDEKLAIMDKLVDDSGMGDYTVLVEGNTRFGNNNEIAMFLSSISSCRIDWNSIVTEIPKKKVPDKYMKVIPKPYIDTVRSSSIIPNYLIGKKIVVFDFETTGTDPNKDTPIELGAVSIIDGVITEQFSTFINPRRQIPPEITRITNITDIDVAGAPYIDEIIPDFYKFAENALLVGHNTEFDYAFLRNAAHEDGYIFDNERQDTLYLSRKLFPQLDSHTLESLCRCLNIVNEGAHRAIYDAIATARLYMLLIDRL